MNFLKNMIRTTIQKREAVYLFLIIIVIILSILYDDITKSLLPNAKFPYVSIYTYMVGASPKDIIIKRQFNIKNDEEVEVIK